MIKTTSFYPFQNLLRVTQEFYEDKAVVKEKSLVFEREFEFTYKDVEEISDAFGPNNSQNNFSFWLVTSAGVGLAVFGFLIKTYPVLLQLGQILYLCGLLLYITSFKKSWRIFISDENDLVLTTIKQTRRNRDLIPQIIEMIKTQSENVKELSVTNPFPEEPAVFVHYEYNISNLVKTADRFYEDKIIGFEKNPFEEHLYYIEYSRLSGKIYHGKLGIEVWGWVMTIVTLLISIISGFYFGFGRSLGIQISLKVAYIIFALVALYLLSLPFSLTKRNVVGFYNKTGKIEYWTHVNQKDKDKFEKIIEFVQTKIPTEEKAKNLKEHQ